MVDGIRCFRGRLCGHGTVVSWPHDGRGLIHGQRTDGPRYPFGPPTPEQVEAERLRREASRAVATAETAVCKVEQLTIEW